MNWFFHQVISQLKTVYRKIRYFYWAQRAKNLGEVPTPPNAHQEAVLFLLPEAGINLYIKTLVAIASQLKLQGSQVYFARCFNIFERCMFMDSERFGIEASPAQKKLLCTYCFRSFEKNVIDNHFEYVDLRHFTNEADKNEIKQVIAQQPNKPFEFSFDGVNVSGILEYNLFLYLKKSDISNLSASEVVLWQQHLTSLYTAYKATERLIKQLNIKHIIMSEEYSFNGMVSELAKKLNISLVNVACPFHKDIDTNRIRVFKNDGLIEFWTAFKRWPEFKNLALPREDIQEAVNDLIIRMTKKGIYAYSPSKAAKNDLMQDLGLDKNKKTIVAYPSSPDEIGAVINAYKKRGVKLPSPMDAFSDQFEWLDELIQFVENSTTLQLVIRLHPRMAPNHREKWGCPEFVEFQKKYAFSYQNVKIIWPADKLSSYDLAELADVVTVAWSSLGLFMARLGIPVVSGLKLSLPLPNDDFHVFCHSKEEYFAQLSLLSNATISAQRILNAYRWYHMITLGYCIDMTDVIDSDPKLNLLSKNAPLLDQALIKGQNVLTINLEKIQNSQSPQHTLDEQQELKSQLWRLMHFFMTDKDDFVFASLPIYQDDLAHQDLHYLAVKDNAVQYCYQQHLYKKYSPLVVRLANLSLLLAISEKTTAALVD